MENGQRVSPTFTAETMDYDAQRDLLPEQGVAGNC